MGKAKGRDTSIGIQPQKIFRALAWSALGRWWRIIRC